MKIITPFDPSTDTNGEFEPLISNACGKIILFNESAYGLLLTFQNGNVQGLPPYYYRSFSVVRPGLVRWQRLYSIAVNGSVSFPVFGEAYESAEAKDLSFTEGPLNRQTNVGNNIPVNLSANALSNEISSNGTLIIDIGPTGANNLILIYNDHFVWNVLQSGVVHKVIEGKTSGNPLTLGQSGDITEVLGQLLIDQDLNAKDIILDSSGTKPKIYSSGTTGNTDIDAPSGTHLWQLSSAGGLTTYGQNLGLGTQGVSRSVMDTSSGNTTLKAASRIHLAVNGTNVLDIDSAGIALLTGVISLLTGNVSRLSIFSGTGTGSAQTVSHNLGDTPSAVFIQYAGNFGSPPTHPVYFYNAGSTQVTIVADNGYSWIALAIK